MGEWLLWWTALLHVFMLCFSVLDGFISLMDHAGVCMACCMPAKFSPLRWPAQITGIQKWITYLIILMGHFYTAYHTGALKWKTHQQWLHMHIILFKRVTHACTQMHASPHTYTHTHIYKHTHTYTHTHQLTHTDPSKAHFSVHLKQSVFRSDIFRCKTTPMEGSWLSLSPISLLISF